MTDLSAAASLVKASPARARPVKAPTGTTLSVDGGWVSV